MLRTGRKSRRRTGAVKLCVQSANDFFLSERAVSGSLAAAALPRGRKRRVQQRNHQGEEHMMSEKSLAGRKALVTGGARGIGAAIAEALANAGASVMIADILVDLGRETAARLAKTGVKTGFVELNVTDDAQWEKAVAATIAALGGYDILVNNAGIEITSLVVDLKAEDLRRMCDVNIVGTGLGMKRRHRQRRLSRRHHRVSGNRRVLRHQIGC
jgi:NADPH:quinone reductase-like Zn-dependent oxidoreductase